MQDQGGRGPAGLREGSGRPEDGPALRRSAAWERRAGGDPLALRMLEVMDASMRDPRLLKSCTGLTTGQFGYLLTLFGEEIGRRKMAPLFAGGGAGAPDPGSRHALESAQALLLVLIRCRSGGARWQLATQFVTDAVDVRGYLRACGPVLEDILPTPDRISAEVAACGTDGERGRFAGGGGGELRVVRARMPLARPGYDDTQPEDWIQELRGRAAGRIGRLSGNVGMSRSGVAAAVSPEGMVLHAGGALPGRRSAAAVLDWVAETFPGAADPGGTPAAAAGGGPGGPGPAIGRAPRRLRKHRILRAPFDWTPERFRRAFNTVAGLANLALAFGEIGSGTGLYGPLAAKWRRQRLERPPGG